ncbi:MAG: diaminopimelate epimerase [Trichodesmium sp. MO_231.B1]|nr:diaminopimelate epimerase [Trichodesmium sp. MO_231.B1]
MMDFYKYHALGNDYIIIDPNKTDIYINKENVETICSRNTGLGSDGILYGPIFNDGKIKLRIFNPDGSEAEKSGNGIRMFSKYLGDVGYIKERTFSISTAGGEVSVEIINLKDGLIKVDMGLTTFQSDLIPVAGERRKVIREPIKVGDESLEVTCISIGNPHCVIPLTNISQERVLQLGPKIENHPIFPNRINLQLLQVLDRYNIQIEIWERGAGYTMASGSSSCAAARVAYELGLVEREVKVHMPGGEIDIDIKPSGRVYMTGVSNAVAEGMFLQEFKSILMGKS